MISVKEFMPKIKLMNFCPGDILSCILTNHIVCSVERYYDKYVCNEIQVYDNLLKCI